MTKATAMIVSKIFFDIRLLLLKKVKFLFCAFMIFSALIITPHASFAELDAGKSYDEGAHELRRKEAEILNEALIKADTLPAKYPLVEKKTIHRQGEDWGHQIVDKKYTKAEKAKLKAEFGNYLETAQDPEMILRFFENEAYLAIKDHILPTAKNILFWMLCLSLFIAAAKALLDPSGNLHVFLGIVARQILFGGFVMWILGGAASYYDLSGTVQTVHPLHLLKSIIKNPLGIYVTDITVAQDME